MNVHRSETLTYMVDGAVDASQAVDVIQDHEPIDSNIRSEDVDVIHIETREV